ncbi:hypothetical protein ACOSQ2_020373 [Xanthoceras sorbifolium]
METWSEFRKMRNRDFLGLCLVRANLSRGVLCREQQQRNNVFSSARSTITKADLKCFVKAFNIPKGYKLLAPTPQDRAAYPPLGYVTINHQHLQVGLRLPFLGFLTNILNLLELALFQLSSNSYSQLISLYLMFPVISRKMVIKHGNGSALVVCLPAA